MVERGRGAGARLCKKPLSPSKTDERTWWSCRPRDVCSGGVQQRVHSLARLLSPQLITTLATTARCISMLPLLHM